MTQSLRLFVWVFFCFCIYQTLATEFKNQHYSLYPSLDKQTGVTSSKIITKSSSAELELTAETSMIEKLPKSDWTPKTSISLMPSRPYLPFVRYERNELAYRPYFEDILYFSCEAWIPNYLKEIPDVLSAKEARSILTKYFVVPQAEWHNSYPKSGNFTNYVKLKFPDNVNLRLVVHEAGIAMILYPDGGAVFLARDLHQYQIDLAKKYKFRLRTGDI